MAVELSSVSEMNTMLHSTMDVLEDKVVQSASELQAAKEEKAELLKQLQELTDARMQARMEADNAKKLKESEADAAKKL